MTRSWARWAAGLPALALLVALPACGPGSETESAGGDEGEAQVEGVETEAVTLYFPGRGGRLYSEEREIPQTADIERRVMLLVEGLLAGPRGEGLYPPLPADAEVAGVHLTGERVAYVDLAAPAASAQPPWGSKRELLAVYSLVNSVLLNPPPSDRGLPITGVVLLWNGQQRPTFAGHLDTTRPLGPNRALLAAS